MRKFLTYTLLALLLGGLFFLFWDNLSSFWKKSSIIASIIAGFFAIKDFISWAFHFILTKFSNIFTYFLAFIASLGIFSLGYSFLPENGSLKTNCKEITSSVVEFFKLPNRSQKNNNEPIAIIPKTSTAESKRTLRSANNINKEEIIRTYTDSSSSELERKNALAQVQKEHEVKEIKQPSTDPIIEILSSDSEETSNKNSDKITQPRTQIPAQSIDPLVALLSNDEETENKIITEGNTTQEIKISEQNNKKGKNNDEEKGTDKGKEEENKNKEETLSFTNDSEKNWKTPVIQILNTPNPSETIVIPTQSQTPKVIANKKENSNPKIIPTQTPLTATGGKLPASGNNDNTFTILFRESPVQIVYPVEYKLSNAIWTDKENTLDSIQFTVTTPKKDTAHINIDIVNSGDIFNKYADQFTTSNYDTNTFFIESTSSQSIEYISFFNGNCWKITITLPTKEPSLEDFYEILLPAVFEAQE